MSTSTHVPETRRDSALRVGIKEGLLAVVVAAFVGWAIYDAVAYGPEAERMTRELQGEYGTISAPASATQRGCQGSSKPHQAVYSCSFDSTLRYEAVRTHYDAAFANAGWSPCDQVAYRGGTRRIYCKDTWSASLSYPAEPMGWTFVVELTWGLEQSCRRTTRCS